MIRICFCLLGALCLASGCDAGRSASSRPSTADTIAAPAFSLHDSTFDTIRYATGFQIKRHNGYTEVEVCDPWNAGQLLQRYVLVPRDQPSDDQTLRKRGVVVRIPTRKMIVYSSVHCTMLDALGATDDIVGVCESRHIMATAIRERVNAGQIIDMGESSSPSVEKLMASGAELIWASSFENGSHGGIEKTGIPIVECADYMETDPLGRAEWIKFVGLLTGKMAEACALFRQTENDYLRLKALVETSPLTKARPRLLTGMRYGSQWYVAAGDSYMAHIYRDAGADYLFDYLKGTGGAPLSFETVFNKAIHADVWLIQYNRANEMTYAAFESDYSAYGRFDAFRQRHIYGCNTGFKPYYDETPLHPDFLLEELIAIFHPELLPADYKFRYFAPLRDAK